MRRTFHSVALARAREWLLRLWRLRMFWETPPAATRTAEEVEVEDPRQDALDTHTDRSKNAAQDVGIPEPRGKETQLQGSSRSECASNDVQANDHEFFGPLRQVLLASDVPHQASQSRGAVKAHVHSVFRGQRARRW